MGHKQKALPIPEVVEDCPSNQEEWERVTHPAPLDQGGGLPTGAPCDIDCTDWEEPLTN